MNKNIGKTFLKYIIAFVIIAGIPNLISKLINITNPIIYLVATITGWLTICYSAGIRLISSNINLKEKLIGVPLLMFIIPLLGSIGFWYGFSIEIKYIEEAFFSAIFGICIAIGFELILPEKFK